MGAVTLHLVRPADGTRLLGSGSTRLTAALPAAAPVPLFFKWYSSLSTDPLGTALDLPAVVLPIGSQVLTLAAKDQLPDTPEALQAVQFAGMAGGPPLPPQPPAPPGYQPCLVHVLVADLREPAANATLNRGGAVLAAVAPVQWGRRKAPPGVGFEPNPVYQALNKLRYLWRFAPAGPPAGRAGATLTPTLAQLAYVAAKTEQGNSYPPQPLVRYSGALPAGLGMGSYTLTLRVEHLDDATQGHESSLAVSLN
jgi:hypothetical protein